jgi:translation initiation factor IF-2
MEEKGKSENLKPRPPIVVVVGHVDHGKTTLLDYVRKSNVAEREVGGITQAVGAYEIIHMQINADEMRINADKISANQRSNQRSNQRESAPAEGRKITFIDTPGHEAFSKMRSRGAEVADLAILVVAADEGVKPQTKEAIDILNQAKTPFVVAINKIDKTGGDIEKAANDLANAGVLLEGRGGQVSFHGISAKTGEGVNELLDLVLLVADLENLTYDAAAPASGYVLEVRHNPQRGSEAAVIVKNGTLKRGDDIYTPTTKGKVKILENFLGRTAEKLEPSSPALIVGLEQPPEVGETFSASPLVAAPATPLIQVQDSLKGVEAIKSEKPTLNLILKAADAGSLEALSVVIKSLEKGEKELKVVGELVGDITDGDVKSAIATGATIIGFKNKVDRAAKNLAQAQEVKIITSDVIYDLEKAVKEFFETLGKPAVLGELEVLAIFNQKKLDKQLIGGRVASGVIRSKAIFEVADAAAAAGGKVGTTGRILNVREKKADVTQAEQGMEVGLLVNFNSPIKVGDRIIVRK